MSDRGSDFHDLAVLNQDWLKCFINLDSVPSKDTIARFMRAVDPVKINECFMNWVQAAVGALKGTMFNFTLSTKCARRYVDISKRPAIPLL